jgi:hypothetical protein
MKALSINQLDRDGLEEFLSRDFALEPQGHPAVESARRYYRPRSPLAQKPLLVGGRKWLIDQLDIETSRIVRARDGRCVIAHCRIRQNLQCSHFYSRRYLHIRFDLRNCNAMCAACNQAHHADQSAYLSYMLKRWGQRAIDELTALKSCMVKITDEQLKQALSVYRGL